MARRRAADSGLRCSPCQQVPHCRPPTQVGSSSDTSGLTYLPRQLRQRLMAKAAAQLLTAAMQKKKKEGGGGRRCPDGPLVLVPADAAQERDDGHQRERCVSVAIPVWPFPSSADQQRQWLLWERYGGCGGQGGGRS